jgi:hypothetical protein
MGTKLDKQKTDTFEEVLVATVYRQEAMMNQLERNGL